MANANTYNSSDILGDNVKTAIVSVTSAQVLALFTTPIQMIAAPPAGYFIDIIRVHSSIAFNTTIYATNTSAGLQFAGAPTVMCSSSQLLVSSVSRNILWTVAAGLVTSGQTSILSAAAVNLVVLTGNPTDGNSPIKMFIDYKILPA